MRAPGAFQQVIPVTSNPVVPIFRERIPVPEMGLRWGKTANFITPQQQAVDSGNVTPKPPRNATEVQHEVRFEEIPHGVIRVLQVVAVPFIFVRWFLDFYYEDPDGGFIHYAGYHPYPPLESNSGYLTEAWLPWGKDTLKEYVGFNPDGSGRYQEHEVNWYLHVDVQGNFPGRETYTETVGEGIPPPT